METIPNGIEEIDTQRVILYANSAQNKQYEYNDGNLIGKSIMDLVPTDSERDNLRGYLKYLVDKQPLPAPYQSNIKTASGKIIDIEVAWNYIKEEDQVIGFTSVVTDVSERNKTQRALKISEKRSLKLANEMAVMAEIGRVINSSPEIDEVYDQFCQSLAKVLSFNWVTVNWIDTVNDVVTVAYHAGSLPIRINQGYSFYILGSFSGGIVNTTGGLLIQGESTEDIRYRFPSLNALLGAGAQSVIGVPLVHRKHVIAVLIFGSSSAAGYTQEDLIMAGNISTQITGAIANAQLYAESQEDKLRLSSERAIGATEMAVVDEVARIITSTLDIDQVYEQFALEVKKLVDFDRMSLVAGGY